VLGGCGDPEASAAASLDIRFFASLAMMEKGQNLRRLAQKAF
jgi:hypothetical protein